jgi:hypothetical protein
MKATVRRALVLAAVLACAEAAAQQPQPQPDAVPAARFVGTWVGTQAWSIKNPPPGAQQDLPVTLTIESVEGTLTGTMRPFLGGEEGVVFTEAAIVGDELRATAVAGQPQRGRGATAAPRQPQVGRGGRGWKDPIRVQFAFRNDGLLVLKGTADVKMGDVPWMTFSYDLDKKRSRY